MRNFLVEHMTEGPRVVWRANDNVPPAGRYIGSTYDPEARYATKGSTVWTGYKVHLTETCDDATPNLITNVETTSAAVADDAVTSAIHAGLAAHDLLPATHIADTSFVNSAVFVAGRAQYGVDLIGPPAVTSNGRPRLVPGSPRGTSSSTLRSGRRPARRGKPSQSWTPALARGTTPVIKSKFAVADCRACELHAQCTRSKSARRAITIRPEAQHEALRTGRARE